MNAHSLTITALITPLTQEGHVDFEAFNKLVQHQLSSGLSNLLLLGSTGESLLLENEEKQTLIEFAMQIPNVHWWLGCMETSLKKAEEWMDQTADLPIQGYVVLAPYYIKPSQGDIEHYFRHLLNFSSHPCILYNNPSRCSVNVSEEVLYQLFSHPRFLGLKECDLNPLRVFRLRKKMLAHHFLLVGDDSSLPASLSSGANGIISVLSNAFPSLALEVVETFLDSSIPTCTWLKTSQQWLQGCNLIETLGNPKGIKSLLNLLFEINSTLKPPLRKLDPADFHRLNEQLQRSSLIKSPFTVSAI